MYLLCILVSWGVLYVQFALGYLQLYPSQPWDSPSSSRMSRGRDQGGLTVNLIRKDWSKGDRINPPSLYVFVARSSIHWAAALTFLNLLFAASVACRSPCGFHSCHQFQIQPHDGFLNFIPAGLSVVSVFLLSGPTPFTLYVEFAHSQEFLIQEESGKGWVYFSYSQIWAIVYWI